MPNTVASLKLDFKITLDGTVKIIDIGDGLGAGLEGFDRRLVPAIILRDMQKATDAILTPLFGELPYDAMQPESIYLPITRRQCNTVESALDARDLASSKQRVLPYSQVGRLVSHISYAWSKQYSHVIAAPLALTAMEMHKIFWYFLMQKFLPATEQQPIAYWSNDTNPTVVDVSAIDGSNGFFIKIADRSDGGGSDVYYAKDRKALLAQLKRLHQQYLTNTSQYAKHIFIIEPAYITVKQHIGKNYNVTGRAFVTVIYNPETNDVGVKIAAAKWIFPTEPMQSDKTEAQMLSNAKHHITMLDLDALELQILSQSITRSYADILRVCFSHDDLITYFADHPQTEKFKECLRPNASYKMSLEIFNTPATKAQEYQKQREAMMIMINSLMLRDVMPQYDKVNLSVIKRSLRSMNDTDILTKICSLSFYASYVTAAKTFPKDSCRYFPFISTLIEQESEIHKSLDVLIRRYLELKANGSGKYDTTDFNRALRQAAFIGDAAVMKVLIYTHRADVNAYSPTGRTALDFVRSSANLENKAQVIALLEQAGASMMATSSQFFPIPPEEKSEEGAARAKTSPI